MPHPRFKKIYVEITSTCNLSCSFCPPTRRPGAFLTVEQFGRVVDQARELTQHLHLHVKGEPLLHPQIGEFLDLAQQGGLRIHLVTNGTLIDRVRPALLGHPALHQINFSLHSFSGSPQALALYLGPILAFARAAEPTATVVALRFWRESDPRILEAVEREFRWEAPVDREGRGYQVAPRTFVHFEREFTWPSLEHPVEGTRGFCLGLRDQVAVLVDGTVVPCCLDGDGEMSLGNVFIEDLAILVAGPRAQALYRGFSDRRCVEPLCQRCRYRSRFKGS